MLTAPGTTVHRARKLRKEMSLPEGLLWRELRQRPRGLKFRKQHPAGFYVLDFFCAAANLAIEIDGEAHSRGDQPEFDAARDNQMLANGITTLRVPATEVLNNLENVVIHIIETASTLIPPRTGEVAAGTADGGAAAQSGHGGKPLPLRPSGAPPRSGEELR